MDIFRFEAKEISDDGDQQLVRGEGLPGEELVRVARVMPHGLASNPPVGSHGLGIAVNGRRDEVVVVGLEKADIRPKLPAGAMAIYNAFGMVWKLLTGKADLDHAGKDHHIRSAGKVKVEASDWVQLDGDAIYLGKPPYFPVVTTAGPSQHVFAGISPAAPDAPQGSI